MVLSRLFLAVLLSNQCILWPKLLCKLKTWEAVINEQAHTLQLSWCSLRCLRAPHFQLCCVVSFLQSCHFKGQFKLWFKFRDAKTNEQHRLLCCLFKQRSEFFFCLNWRQIHNPEHSTKPWSKDIFSFNKVVTFWNTNTLLSVYQWNHQEKTWNTV